MRLALFTPLPPKKSGIADYSAALLECLRKRAEVDVFDEGAEGYDAGAYDATVYQIGNNPYHAVAYETALRHPGVVVLHESNLHHLICDLTIRRDDWDAYVREAEYDGGPEALAHAERARALEVGPDYEGVPMLRRILESSKAAVVHSRFVEGKLREAGFDGPVAVIPHGAWIPEANRMGYRQRLGLDETATLVGIFGFLKPYKRIAESLRAFARVARLEPRLKMILVGEEHSELSLDGLIQSLDLSASVRRLGFTSPEDFTGYLDACDIVLNLRYPTVGESSGTLQRALGMGKAAMVSDVGSFAELPDEICLKVPVDSSEEETLFEYLRLLVCRPDLRREMGRQAKQWVERECAWPAVADRYVEFLDSVARGGAWTGFAAPEPAKPPVTITQEYLESWTGESAGAREYLDTHVTRLEKTLAITPPGGRQDRVLEMGAYMQITPALHSKLGYGEVRGCYFGAAGEVNHKQVRSAGGEEFECTIDLFNAEKDRFPYDDEHFATVLCCELIEHLAEDPMHMMVEINRVLRPGGHLVLTTPNVISSRAIAGILQGYHPGFFPAYVRPSANGGEVEARHAREYAPREVARLLADSGFEVELLETGPFREEPKPELAWVDHLLERYWLSTELRGDGIYVVGRKTGGVAVRRPDWLYE